MRWVVFLAVVLFASPCLAQRKPAQSIRHGVGDRFATIGPMIVAADEFGSVELARSLVAGDKEGIEMMVADKKAFRLEAGHELVVLEITTFERPRRDKSSVCRVIKDGKAVGKFPIHFSWFTTATMKKTKDVDVVE